MARHDLPPDSPPDSRANSDIPTVDLPTESFEAPPPEPFDPGLPRSRKVGPYSIQSVIASGGMGTVYIAVQEHPRRRVALKMMKRGIASKSALRRFEYESQILARLRHPNIAQVFEAGTHDDGEGGVPYFAMEYVPNARPITDYARTSKLGTRERLALLAKVCDAVHHGHQRGIIHRDLKPSNILVDSDGLPKIIDFGVARSTDSDMAVTTLQTHVGQVVGTLQYMSPEQCDADPDDLDIRTDVYALGVVLYELLTEQLPYDLSTVTMLDVARMIRESTPPRPSAINRTLRGDVETITLKALEKDRTRRYGSAGALAEDMRRYLRSEPIDARPPSVAYLFGRYASRHRPFVLGAAAVLLVLVAGLVVTSLLLVRALDAEALAGDRLLAVEQAESQTSRRAEELEQVAAFQESQLSGIDVEDMAEWLHEDLVASVRAGLERRGRAPSEIDADLAQLTDLLAEASLTGVSLRTLDRNIFERAHIALNEQFAAQPLVKARLLQTLARTQIELGLLAQTTAAQEEAVEIRRRELGDEHADTLSSINNMGYLLAAQGKWSAAEPFYREALEARRRVLGNEHPDTLVSINNMGYLLVARGEWSAAEPYFREALETRRRVLGDEHADTLVSISSMGGLLEAQGKLSEAEPHYFEALETSRRVLGDEHLDTLVAINNAGALLQAQGRLDAAEALYRKALETRRRILGDEHADTLASINNIGYLLQAQGKLPDAERYFREALATRRRVLGDEHPDTLLSLNNLGALLQAQGKLSEAEAYYREALGTRRRVLGDQHTDTLTSINNMGFLLAAQGKLSEAEPYYREAAQTARATLPTGHWFLGAFAFNHGRTLGDLHRFDEAESVLLEAHEILDAALGPDHDRTQRSVSAIVDLYRAWHEAAPDQGYDTKAAEWQAKQPGV